MKRELVMDLLVIGLGLVALVVGTEVGLTVWGVIEKGGN